MDYFDPLYFDPTYFDTPSAAASTGHGASKSARPSQMQFLEPLPEPVKPDEDWITVI